VRRVVLAVAVLFAAGAMALPAGAQVSPPGEVDAASTTQSPTTTDQVPTNDIVPQPNSGAPPEEAGDRGGALQLGLLGLVVAVIAGAVLLLVRQSRRARGLG
jgi:uncharacterized protein HemX